MNSLPLVVVNSEGQLGSFEKGKSAFDKIVRNKTILACRSWGTLPDNNELDYEVI